MNLKLITMFNVMPFATDLDRKSFEEVNVEAAQYGYIVHPDCCTKLALEWVKKDARSNYNATFYKEWKDITSKSRLELLFDQLLHYATAYATAYGTGMTQGNGYVPNDEPDVKVPYEKFKVIMPATEEDIYNRCYDMLKSGIALKTDTIDVLIDYMKPVLDKYKFDIDEVKNKEAQVYFCDKLCIRPNDPFALLRYIVYKATGKSMLIKDKATIWALKNSTEADLTGLSEKQKIGLASIFYRFKPLFLAMKKSGKTVKNTRVFENRAFQAAAKKLGKLVGGIETNAKVVNEIRRMAVKYHKPFHAGFWETIISDEKDINEVKARLAKGEINNFKKITIMQGVQQKLQGGKGKMFVIRNGKMWVREDYMTKKSIMNYLMKLYMALEDSVVESIKDKACIVCMPKNVNFTVPTSEKNFIGNYPFGTSVDCGTDHTVIGIYWRNEWGTRDFDLHMADMFGVSYGWNSSFTNNGNTVIFSGDMINADPEATELFYIGKGAPDGKISVNRYSGDSKTTTQFKLFVANEDVADRAKHNYEYGYSDIRKAIMCDPNNVRAEFMIPMDNTGRQKECALIADNRVYLMDLAVSGGRVPNHKYAQTYIEQLKNKCRTFVSLNDILTQAGFTFVDDSFEETEDQKVGLDLTNPDKDSLIKLFAD